MHLGDFLLDGTPIWKCHSVGGDFIFASASKPHLGDFLHDGAMCSLCDQSVFRALEFPNLATGLCTETRKTFEEHCLE